MAQQLADVRNTPPPVPAPRAQATAPVPAAGKQGYVLLPKVGDDAARQVCMPAAMRILDGKAPYPVLVANARDLVALDEALEVFRTEVTGQLRTESDPRKIAALEAQRAAAERVTVIDHRESGVLRTLDPARHKLYLAGHGAAGLDGVAYRRGGASYLVTTQAIARQLADAGLDPGFRDIRLQACEGACAPEEGGPSTAERLAVALARAGFGSVALSAYPGNIEVGDVFDDGRHHKAVPMGPEREPVPASHVRQTFRPGRDIDHLSPR